MKRFIYFSFFILVAISVYLIFFSKIDFKSGLMSDAAGEWSVGIISLDNNESEFNVFEKIKDRGFLKIPNNSAVTGDSMYFLADPFLFVNNDTTYLFVEAQPFKDRGAYICVYRIDDGLNSFEYLGIALKENFHLSYPHVVKIDEEIFLIPETQGGDSSFVYRSVKFPLVWEKFDYLLAGKIKDPTLVPINDSSGYFYYAKQGLLLSRKYDFYNNNFLVGEEEYLKTGTAFRPGGSSFVNSGSVYLPIQDNSNGYGTSLRAIEVDNGKFVKINEKFLLMPNPDVPEFTAGMHHLSSVDKNGKKIIAFDGRYLVSSNLGFNYKFFIKYNYLNIWDELFGSSRKPWYPFGE